MWLRALTIALLLSHAGKLQAQQDSLENTGSAGHLIFFQESGSRGGEPMERNNVFLVSAIASSVDDKPVFTLHHEWPNSLAGSEANFGYLTQQGLALVTGAHSITRNGTKTTPASASPNRHGVGAYGVIRLLDVDGSVLWQFTKCDYEANGEGGLSAGQECLHHDIEPRSNGNILVTAHSKVPRAILQSRVGWNNQNAKVQFLWVEKIYELKPIFGRSSQLRCKAHGLQWSKEKPWCTQIVWTLDLLDYLSGDLADPYKINSNIVDPSNTTGGLKNVLLHLNSISFNENLQQLMLSSALYSELFIFDYASKKLLYRWGNPKNYDCNGAVSHALCARVTQRQHDPSWTSDTTIMIHNNNQGTKPSNPDDPDCASGPCAKIVEIQLPPFENGRYKLEGSKPFYPFPGENADSGYKVLYGPFATGFGSGVQRFGNGDLLITKTVNREIRRVQLTSPPGGDDGFAAEKRGDWVWTSQVPYFDKPTEENRFQVAQCRTAANKRPCPMIFKAQLLAAESENIQNFQQRRRQHLSGHKD